MTVGAVELFGSGVRVGPYCARDGRRSANLRQHRRGVGRAARRRRVRFELGQSEVSDLSQSGRLAYEYIFWFDVSMDDVAVVDVV